MEGKEFSHEQIIGTPKEAEAGAVVTESCRKHGMSSATSCAWNTRFGRLAAPDAKQWRVLGKLEIRQGCAVGFAAGKGRTHDDAFHVPSP